MKLGLGGERRVKVRVVSKDGPGPGKGFAGTGDEGDFFGFAACEQGLVKEVQLVVAPGTTERAQEEFAAQQGIALSGDGSPVTDGGAAFVGDRIEVQVGDQLLGGAVAVGSSPETMQLDQEQRADLFADAWDRQQEGELLLDGGLCVLQLLDGGLDGH